MAVHCSMQMEFSACSTLCNCCSWWLWGYKLQGRQLSPEGSASSGGQELISDRATQSVCKLAITFRIMSAILLSKMTYSSSERAQGADTFDGALIMATTGNATTDECCVFMCTTSSPSPGSICAVRFHHRMVCLMLASA